jgi:protein O-mannosyl-transferase
MTTLFTDARKKQFFVAIALVALTLICYQTLKDHQFISYDDEQYITENYRVQAGLSWPNIVWAFTTTDAANWHPLTWLSHMLDCQLYGLNPSGHHWTNLLIHIVNVLLLFFLLHRITGALWRSTTVAALFAVHPLNIESVAWVAERKNVLCALFWLLTIWAYSWYAQKTGWKRYLLVILLFAVALMSKPMAVTLPCVLLLLDYWPLDRIAELASGAGRFKLHSDEELNRPFGGGARKPLSRLVTEKIPLFLLAGASSLITIKAQKAGGAMATSAGIPPASRVTNALVSYAGYLYKMVWPVDLAVFYPHPEASLPHWKVAIAAAVLCAVSGFVVWKGTRLRYLTVGWLWYLGTLIPVIGLVQVGGQASADRYAYIPLMGVFIAIVWLVADWADSLRSRVYVAACVAGLVVLALVIDTRRQLDYWQNSVTLFVRALQVTSDNYIAYHELGVAYVKLSGALTDAGRPVEGKRLLDEGIKDFQAALAIKPDYYIAYMNLGAALTLEGRLDEAISALNHVLASPVDKGTEASAEYNLAVATAGKGDKLEAERHYQKAVLLDPSHYKAYSNLASLQLERGDLVGAAANYLQAAEIYPTAFAYSAVALALEKQGKLPEALHFYREAQKLDPRDRSLEEKIKEVAGRPR